MTKTPDEIKKGLECMVRSCNATCDYSCTKCDLHMKGYTVDARCEDVFALVQQLQTENADKDTRIRQLEAERDALVADIRMDGGLCSICKYADNMAHSESCRDCNALVASDHSNWQWRGVPKEPEA